MNIVPKQLFSALLFLIYLIILILLFCAAAEVLARHFRPQLIHLSREREKFCMHDPEIGWVGKPLASGQFTTQDFDVPVQINSQGMRDVEFSPEKPEGFFRIVVLGDSFTWGYGVENGQTFSKKIESSFEKIQVLNFGCSGYGQDQELLLLKRIASQYKPDLVIVNIHTSSDFENNTSFFQYGYYKPFFKEENGKLILENTPVPRNTPGTAFNSWLSEKSVAWRILGNRKIRNLNLDAVWPALIDKKTSLIKKALHNLRPADLTCRLCREIETYSAGNGSKTLFLFAPNLQLPVAGKKNGLYPEDPLYQEFRNCLQKNNLNFIDLRPVFEKQMSEAPDTQLTFTHDAHWNAKGHEIVAEGVINYLLKNDQLKAKL